MNFLDTRTVLFSMLATDVLCTLVLVQLWLQNRERFSGIGLWAAGSFLETFALFLTVLRGAVPDFISLVLSNTILIAGAILSYIGLERFIDRKGTQVHNYFLLFFVFIIQIYFSFNDPNLRLRIINISVAIFIVFFQYTWLMLIKVGPDLRQLTRGLGFIGVGWCLLSIFRIVDQIVRVQSGNNYFHLDWIETLILVLFQLLIIMMTYGLYLMVNKRLHIHIENEEEKFSRAFHGAPYAIVLTRLSDGKIVEVNEAFVEATGYTRAEVLGETTLDIHFWQSKDSRDNLVGELSKNGLIRNVETPFRTKSKEMRTGLVSAGLIHINNEKSVLSSIVDITERKSAEDERKQLITELQDALANVKTLSGLLPICAYCKKIRNDEGYWQQLEVYIRERSEAHFSHGICPDCREKVMAEFNEELKEAGDEGPAQGADHAKLSPPES